MPFPRSVIVADTFAEVAVISLTVPVVTEANVWDSVLKDFSLPYLIVSTSLA
ncbi:hypothetical protein ES705_42066 [subsurface metagenome]